MESLTRAVNLFCGWLCREGGLFSLYDGPGSVWFARIERRRQRPSWLRCAGPFSNNFLTGFGSLEDATAFSDAMAGQTMLERDPPQDISQLDATLEVAGYIQSCTDSARCNGVNQGDWVQFNANGTISHVADPTRTIRAQYDEQLEDNRLYVQLGMTRPGERNPLSDRRDEVPPFTMRMAGQTRHYDDKGKPWVDVDWAIIPNWVLLTCIGGIRIRIPGPRALVEIQNQHLRLGHVGQR